MKETDGQQNKEKPLCTLSLNVSHFLREKREKKKKTYQISHMLPLLKIPLQSSFSTAFSICIVFMILGSEVNPSLSHT